MSEFSLKHEIKYRLITLGRVSVAYSLINRDDARHLALEWGCYCCFWRASGQYEFRKTPFNLEENDKINKVIR